MPAARARPMHLPCGWVHSLLGPAALVCDSYAENKPGTQATPRASDWRAFRAALVNAEAGPGGDAGKAQAPLGAPGGWAHPIVRPERGCLLLARHADMGPAFDHSVIFVLDHGAPLRPLSLPITLQSAATSGVLAVRHAA